ncbi:MAG: HAD-IC family P-type ATPase [Clostridia bacterium]|nr:HAD-IC family P-type ATPase [Clostridia bacterium]
MEEIEVKEKEQEKKKSALAAKLGSLFRKKKGPDLSGVLRYDTDPDKGLTPEQVEKRTTDGLTNKTDSKSSKTVSQIILSNIFTYFNIIFFVIAAILIVEKSYTHLTFLIVVVVNTVIGTVQELRSKKTLEKLTLVSAPLTTAIRDGETVRFNAEDLVLDDIVVFEAGNQIIADAIVCTGEVTVNEALVTGESDEIKKAPGDSLLSGSFIVSGSCRAKLDKVGNESFAAKLSVDAKRIRKKQQPGMMKSLTTLIKVIGIIIIPLAAATFLNQHVRLGLSVHDSVENTAGSVIGMIPEGLYLLTSVALAVSAIRLANRKTLVHDMKCIETLARVDVICVDKTGTVTEPEMHLCEVIPLDPDDGETVNGSLRDFALNMSADNITIAALKEYYNDKRPYRRAEKIRPFSSATKFSAVSLGEKSAHMLGAPEFLMRADYGSLRKRVEERSGMGERVLLFAEYVWQNEAGNIFSDGDFANGNMIPLALVTFKNPIRPEARETFGYFTDQGVRIKVISGDNPITVARAAEEAGIPDSDKFIDATSLTTKEKIADAIEQYTVFGRVTPDQKRDFVKALKKAGHTVAMTGDGVNDVLALKDADCSIAMASGSDAASNVSDLVLLDSNFASMPHVVAEGRRVINNIERSAALFIVKNIFSFFMTIIALISMSLYPFKPSQLSLVSAAMIGIPSFILALEPNTNLVKGKFMRNVLMRAFPFAITAIIMVCWEMLFASAFSSSISSQLSSTIAFFIYTVISYIMLFHTCRPMTLIHKILFVAMGLFVAVAVLLIPDFFALVPLSAGGLLILFTLTVISVPLSYLLRRIFSNLGKWRDKFRDYVKKDLEQANPTDMEDDDI